VLLCDGTAAQALARGIDLEGARAANAALLTVALPPFGERGPDAEAAGSAGLVAAAGGLAALQASATGEPVSLVVPLAEYAQGALAALAVAAGLFARERGAGGQHLEVSGLGAALALQAGAVSTELGARAGSGPHPLGELGPTPLYRFYRCGDGRWLFLACGTDEFMLRLLDVIGRAELAADAALAAGQWGTASEAGRALLVPLLERAFGSAPREQWLARLRAADVPAQPLWSRDECLASELVAASGLRASVAHAELGAVEMVGVPVELAATPGAVRGPAPLPGEHTAELLAEPERRPRASARAEAPRRLLEGVRVLEIASFIAGPLAARHLAALGAEVVKLEPPGGDPFRVLAQGFLGWNQGKRSIVADLGTAGGAEVLERLAAGVDVVVENLRPGVAERLGAGYERLAAGRPGLVYASTSGYGDVAGWREAPAFDGLVQALSGLAEAQGGDGPPVYHTVPVADVFAPLLTAFGVCAALYVRERTGVGQRVRTSLLGAALAAQAGELVRYAGARAARRGGAAYRGRSAGERAYACMGGEWLHVEARSVHAREALARCTGVTVDAASVAGPAEGPAAGALAAAFTARRRHEWQALLRAAGVPCAAVVTRAGLLGSDALRANGLVVQHFHPLWASTVEPGVPIRAAATPGAIARRAPLPGEHTAAILEELGYSEAERAALESAGAVVALDMQVRSRDTRGGTPTAAATLAELMGRAILWHHDVG
jgi:crotonobetainyl-CoA:carnitine CoA-transferase CaiB-like acyl-CoA transferase